LILKHAKFIKELEDFELTEEAAKYLRNGTISILGRDKKGQPNLIWNLERCGKPNKEMIVPMTVALKFAIFVLRKYCIIGKYCEKFNFVLD